nr:hypothetical protein [Granulicella sp. dw_53]
MSPNYFIEVAATRGLIHIQDKDSIALIAAAIRKAPAAVARTMAQPLAYVDDPLAQQTVDKYVPPESAKALRAAKADGRTPLY